MKPTKTKKKLTGEEQLAKAAEQMRSLADAIHKDLQPTTKIEMLIDDMGLMAKEIRGSIARSKLAMLASIDILLAGEDFLCDDLLGWLQDDRHQFVNEPESPDDKERKNLLSEITTMLSPRSTAMLEQVIDILKGMKSDTIRISA